MTAMAGRGGPAIKPLQRLAQEVLCHIVLPEEVICRLGLQ